MLSKSIYLILYSLEAQEIRENVQVKKEKSRKAEMQLDAHQDHFCVYCVISFNLSNKFFFCASCISN